MNNHDSYPHIVDPSPMSDPRLLDQHATATQGLVVQVFQMLSDKLEQSHKSLRESLDAHTARIENRMTIHDKEDRAVADRLLVMETNRARDLAEVADEKERMKGEMDRRMAAISILVAVVGMVIGHFWK